MIELDKRTPLDRLKILEHQLEQFDLPKAKLHYKDKFELMKHDLGQIICDLEEAEKKRWKKHERLRDACLDLINGLRD